MKLIEVKTHPDWFRQLLLDLSKVAPAPFNQLSSNMFISMADPESGFTSKDIYSPHLSVVYTSESAHVVTMHSMKLFNDVKEVLRKGGWPFVSPWSAREVSPDFMVYPKAAK